MVLRSKNICLVMALFLLPLSVASDVGSFSFQDQWNMQWLRILHRYSMPDPDGPMLQRFDGLYGRYQINMTVPEFPGWLEQQWQQSTHGVRLWAQSVTEHEFAARAQIKTTASTWKNGYISFYYDQLENRTTDLSTFRFDVGHAGIGGTNLDAALRLYSASEKTDLDVEFLARYSIQGLGSAGLRFMLLDAFLNLTDTLARNRNAQVDEFIRHETVPLALAFDVQTAVFAGIRGEVYAGGVIPQRRSHEFPATPAMDHVRYRRAFLAAGLVEWKLPWIPAAAGCSMSLVDAIMTREYESADDSTIQEKTSELRFYMLAKPHRSLRIQGFLTRTRQPEVHSNPDYTHEDEAWLGSLRLLWQPGRVVGADIGWYQSSRTGDGLHAGSVNGQFSRLVTRVQLQLGADVWMTFGVGWQFDPDLHPYDKGGITLIWTR